MTTLGPGELTFGAVGSEIDVSCNVNSATLTPSKDQGDSKTMLCGTVKPGSVTYTYSLTGNLDLDLEAGEDGFFALTQLQSGSQVPFVFTPNTAEGTAASGTVVIDPLDFGGEEYGADLSSDFEFAVVGAITWEWGGGGGTAATGATAGTPGTWTPGGATAPANLAACTGVTASPASAWTTGQHVVTGDTQHVHWDGAAWATGDAA
jgi:hypothetical protein